MFIKGPEIDEDSNPIAKSASVEKNGFNPTFNLDSEFNIQFPEHSFLII